LLIAVVVCLCWSPYFTLLCLTPALIRIPVLGLLWYWNPPASQREPSIIHYLCSSDYHSISQSLVITVHSTENVPWKDQGSLFSVAFKDIPSRDGPYSMLPGNVSKMSLIHYPRNHSVSVTWPWVRDFFC
jgi:hypothetical protein